VNFQFYDVGLQVKSGVGKCLKPRRHRFILQRDAPFVFLSELIQ
jgi:hypothetical protein